MDYISAETFSKQDENIKRVLLNWWKPQLKDFFFRDFGNNPKSYIRGIYESVIMDYETQNNAAKDKTFLPLLTEDQLKKFIEDKGYKYIGINNFIKLEDKETWNIKVFKSMMQFEPDIELYCDTPLECYWTAALLIAAEEVEHGLPS
jgi:hypothetical protein